MEKTTEQLIADFKKANKARRKKIVEREGFITEDEFVAWLERKAKNAKKTTDKAKKKVVSVVETPTTPVKEKEKMDYVVAFDTTGSMGSYIGAVKAHVEKLIPELFSNDVDLKMRIIAFGDYCDMRDVNKNVFGNAYQESLFTDHQSDLINFVKGAYSTGGGDSEEFYELVIKKITEETPWREGAKKSVLFIADDQPHKPGYSYRDKTFQIDWKQEAKKAADKGIAFDTLSIHGDTYPWYRELAKITNGVYMPFQSSTKTAELVRGVMYARSGDTVSKSKFKAAFASTVASGDTELIGTYKSLSKLMEE